MAPEDALQVTQDQADELKKIGRRLPRQRRQRGTVTKRGRYYSGQFDSYERQSDGSEVKHHRTVSLGKVNSMTKADAQLKLQAIIYQETNVTPSADARMTLMEFWEQRYLPIKLLTWKETNRDHEKYMVEHYILEPLGHIHLDQLDKVVVSKELNALAAAGRSKSTVGKFKINLKALLEEAEEQLPGFRSCIHKLKTPVTRSENNRSLSLEELRDLMLVANAEERLILRMFFVLGLRPGECYALQRNDVEPPILRIDLAAIAGHGLVDTKTVKSKAPLFMPPSLCQDVVDWVGKMKARHPEAFLFPNRRGGPVDTHNFLARKLKPLAMQARLARIERGQKVTPGYLEGINHQALRRTCATFAGSKGVGTLKDAQAILRHASPDVTAETYMQSIPESVRETLGSMDDMLRVG